jgi:ankyrin repeat protein
LVGIAPGDAVIDGGGHQSTLPVLLDKKTPTEVGTDDLSVGLSGASAISDTQTAQMLLSHGADVQYQGDDVKTPWHIALANGHGSMVKMLPGHGPPPSVTPDPSP